MAGMNNTASPALLTLLPKNYCFTVLSITGSFIALVGLGGRVVKARSKAGVALPAAYATVVKSNDGSTVTDAKSPEDAYAFNRAQRGHHNALETASSVQVLAAVAGIHWPIVSATSLGLWTFGAIMYAVQYSQHSDKRNKGLAVAKYIGMLGLLVSNTAFAIKLATS